MTAVVTAVALKKSHGVGKHLQLSIRLVEGRGVEGDAHLGEKVMHRSRARANPDLPNLRQVHLIQAELHDELNAKGFTILPGVMGENITTRGIDLLSLPEGARLHLGAEAIVELSGLRNPCSQLDQIQKGLMAATLEKQPDGTLRRKAGVMGVVVAAGEVKAGDAIVVELPPEPHETMIPI